MAVDAPAGEVRAATETLETPGGPRSVLVVRPPDPAATPDRLLLVLHGSNQTGSGFRRFAGGGFDAWAARGDAVVAYPDSWHRGLWNDARISTPSAARSAGVDDVAFLVALLDRFRAEGVTRVFAAGFSNGGEMVIRLLHAVPERLSGAALIGATMPDATNFSDDGAAPRPMPMLLLHGTKDPLVPFEGGVASLFGFRPRGLMRSADASAAYWVARNGLTAEPVTTTLPHRTDSTATTVHRTTWEQAGRPPVVAYAVEHGGHVVPNPVRSAPVILGRSTPDLDAPAEVLALFDRA